MNIQYFAYWSNQIHIFIDGKYERLLFEVFVVQQEHKDKDSTNTNTEKLNTLVLYGIDQCVLRLCLRCMTLDWTYCIFEAYWNLFDVDNDHITIDYVSKFGRDWMILWLSRQFNNALLYKIKISQARPDSWALNSRHQLLDNFIIFKWKFQDLIE